jgi:hypothetical protein
MVFTSRRAVNTYGASFGFADGSDSVPQSRYRYQALFILKYGRFKNHPITLVIYNP